MPDRTSQVARAVAARLDHDRPGTSPEVEAALHGPSRQPDQYVDPISLGGLIVSIASLGWSIYTDLKIRTPKPPPDVVARTIRVRLADGPGPTDPAQRDRIVELTVEELTRDPGGA